MAGVSSPWAGATLPLDDFDELPLCDRKARRLMSNSDEEIVDEMDRREESFRVGWPMLHPLPLRTFPLPGRLMDSDMRAKITDIEQILDTQKIRGRNPLDVTVQLAYRLPLESVEGEDSDEEYLTILVRLDMLQHSHRIQHALIAIRRVLKTSPNTESLMIEFLDNRAGQSGPAFSPIGFPHQNIADNWDAICNDIISNFLKKERWICVECVIREHKADPVASRPCLVITSPSAKSPRWWSTIIPKIQMYVNSEMFKVKYETTFEVHLRQGTTVAIGAQRDRIPKLMPESEYAQIGPFKAKIAMGSSVSRLKENEDEQVAGTIGGMIQLEGKDTSKPAYSQQFGLTNYHVVRDDDLDKRK